MPWGITREDVRAFFEEVGPLPPVIDVAEFRALAAASAGMIASIEADLRRQEGGVPEDIEAWLEVAREASVPAFYEILEELEAGEHLLDDAATARVVAEVRGAAAAGGDVVRAWRSVPALRGLVPFRDGNRYLLYVAEPFPGIERPAAFFYWSVMLWFGVWRLQERERVSVATHPVALHMMRALLSGDTGLMETLRVTEGGKRRMVRAQSLVDVPAGALSADAPAEEVLALQRRLLAPKRQGVTLLKTHLDLVDQAYRAGGERPEFAYRLQDALARLGYQRRADGSFNAGTLRQHYERVLALTGQHVRLLEGELEGGALVRDSTPYWLVRARRELVAGGGDAVARSLLAEAGAPIVTDLLVQPGAWWQRAEMGAYRYPLPRAVLRLPTDGRGHERQRLAVRLGAVLAVWVRSSQHRHGGETQRYSVGVLLEKAGVTTWPAFRSLASEQAKRLRTYLAGGDYMSGALGLLRELQAFNVDIHDDAAFCASGRGWRERFWGAQLGVEIPPPPQSKRA